MRAFDNGRVVAVSEQDILDFCRKWPASGLRGLRGVRFEFDRNGDLVDVTYKNGTSDKWDGPALVALSQDAQAYGDQVRAKVKGGGGARASAAKTKGAGQVSTRTLGFTELPLSVMQGLGYGEGAFERAVHSVTPGGPETIVVEFNARPLRSGVREVAQVWRRNPRKRDVQWERIERRYAQPRGK
jgi:hypothetical protein